MENHYIANGRAMSSSALYPERMLFGRMVLGVVLLGTAAAPVAQPALFRRAGAGGANRSSAITLRKRLHVNTLITPPGEMEVEWGGAFSAGGAFSLPAAIKYTPEGTHAYWGRTELSASFDSLSSAVQFDDRITQFSDRVTFAANCVVHDGAKLDLAIAPQASFLLRGDRGARLGASGIARYDVGRSSAGASFTWTAATESSPTNPAGTFDLGTGYGFQLLPSGPLSHLTAHTNWLYEKSTGAEREISLFEGVEYQITGKVAVDLSGQHFSAWGGPVDNQVVIGLTVSLGRLRGRAKTD
jgi:hypothetical protein